MECKSTLLGRDHFIVYEVHVHPNLLALIWYLLLCKLFVKAVFPKVLVLRGFTLRVLCLFSDGFNCEVSE